MGLSLFTYQFHAKVSKGGRYESLLPPGEHVFEGKKIVSADETSPEHLRRKARRGTFR